MITKKAQVWIETVIYTLIGLTIMGIILSLVTPAINQKKDQLIVQGSLDILKNFENIIEHIRFYGVGNSWPTSVNLNKGTLEIDGINESILISIDSSYQYSELDQEIFEGRISKKTIKKGDNYLVILKLEYINKLNISYNKADTSKIFNYAPTPYKINLINYGKTGNLTNIDFS